ncbi:hypothetical protein KCP70_11355 [Salmonella enterica subsp. enterica]|nr:hypothetical protein KCP70_11355 [Salmonella enterica subsp. enterica]
MRALISFFWIIISLECRNGASRNRTATLDARRSGDRRQTSVNASKPRNCANINLLKRFLLVVRQLRMQKRPTSAALTKRWKRMAIGNRDATTANDAVPGVGRRRYSLGSSTDRSNWNGMPVMCRLLNW